MAALGWHPPPRPLRSPHKSLQCTSPLGDLFMGFWKRNYCSPHMHAKVTCTLPRCEVGGNSPRLAMFIPTTGLHKYSHHQILYEAIRKLLGKKEWKPLQHEIQIGGTTWIQLLARFDTLGYSRRHDDFVAAKAKGKHSTAKTRSPKTAKTGRSCVAKSSLKVEL